MHQKERSMSGCLSALLLSCLYNDRKYFSGTLMAFASFTGDTTTIGFLMLSSALRDMLLCMLLCTFYLSSTVYTVSHVNCEGVMVKPNVKDKTCFLSYL